MCTDLHLNINLKPGSKLMFDFIYELKVFNWRDFGFLSLSLHKSENTVNRQKKMKYEQTFQNIERNKTMFWCV